MHYRAFIQTWTSDQAEPRHLRELHKQDVGGNPLPFHPIFQRPKLLCENRTLGSCIATEWGISKKINYLIKGQAVNKGIIKRGATG